MHTTQTQITLSAASLGDCAGSIETPQNCTDCPNIGAFLSCDPQTCDWLLLNGFWVGNVTEGGGPLVTGCPTEYCAFDEGDTVVRIPRSAIQSLSEFLCNGSHRMGTVCGQCQPGYAPAVNTDTNYCVPCNSQSSKVNWIYYLLAVYVPRLAVFLVIVVFNIRLSAGPLNSFILFAQIISTTVDIGEQGEAPLNILYGSGTSAFQKSFKIPYNLFNLNIFGNLLPPFCLHESLDTLGVIALHYVDALTPLIVILGMAVLLGCRKCLKMEAAVRTGCVFRKCRVSGSSLMQALAAFTVLSYNRLCETTTYLLITQPLYDSNLQSVGEVLFFQGTKSTSDPIYTLRYKIPAYLVMTALIVVSITLLHYPIKMVEWLISKVSCLRKLYPKAILAEFLDAFQGCFKDNRRWFAGLYFVLRLLLILAYIQPLLRQLLIQQILFVAFTFLFAIFKPYKDRRLNYLDIFMFANLALINILTWYTANGIVPDIPPIVACIIFESTLVYLPMLYFVAYLLWHSTRRCRESTKIKVMEWSHKVDERIQRPNHIQGEDPSSYVEIDNQILSGRFGNSLELNSRKGNTNARIV
ncbi:hypothetical protein EMCRGX_G009451 [Ephydatia muelleri]